MNIIPFPRNLKLSNEETVSLDGTWRIVANNNDVSTIAEWFVTQIKALSGRTFAESSVQVITLRIDPLLHVDLDTTGNRADGRSLAREAHRIEIAPARITVSGVTPEAVFRGATTLLHMMVHNEPISAGTIEDAPRFGWRGLSMDVVRTFHPVKTVKKVIDLLALYKMNVLHLHLTDSEGWRFPVPDYPLLTEISGKTARDGRPGDSYSRQEYADILNYAAERFITVVPEFDSPGHTASVLRAYPELAQDDIHAMPEAMRYLHPDQPGVVELLRAVYLEMDHVHPGAFLHVGGDEAIAMDEDTFRRYMEQALPLARETGKHIVAWQETARAGFSPGDLMQLWMSPHTIARVQAAVENPESSPMMQSFPDPDVRDGFIKLILQMPEDLPKALSQGANIIFSEAHLLYLDTKYVEPSLNQTQKAQHARVGLPEMVYGNGTVVDSYDWDPATVKPGLPIERMAGIEAAIWCETIVDEEDLFFQLLPRFPGVAEKAWSDNRSWDDYQPRLTAQRSMWETLGLPYFVSSAVWSSGDA